MAIIGDFGSAPDHQQQGYRGQGYVVHGTEEEVLNVFRTVDVVLVKGAALLASNNEFEFYPMFRVQDLNGHRYEASLNLMVGENQQTTTKI